ncbi:MAG: diacylglycerol kinase family protein [Patescibacteria group bacterium]
MTKIALVIFNKSAGLMTKQDIEGLVRNKLEELGYQVDLFYLNDNFETAISGHNFLGTELVVAVGGDGTVKVATKTILNNKLSAPLGIIPFGSANVMATDLGIPLTVKQAIKLLAQPEKTVKIDVGLINQNHYFLVGLSIGYISHVIASTPGDLKNKFGYFGYLWRFIFNKIKIRKIKFKIKTQNKTFWVKGNSLVIFNAINYFGLKLKKNIDWQDGILNLYVFTNKTLLSLISDLFYLLWRQQPKKHIFTLDNDYFKIYLNRGWNSYQIDGDYLKISKEIEVEVLPKALEVVIP